MNSRRLVAGLIIACIYAQASAVVIKGGDGSGNTTAPIASGVTFPYWDSIGRITREGDPTFSGGGTAVYLGNGYCLTAYHVKYLDNPQHVYFGGVSYSIDPTSWDPIDHGSTTADVVLFRISGAYPDIPYVPYEDIPASVSNGTQLYVMGWGRNRNGGETTYYITPDGSDSDIYADLYTSDPGGDRQLVNGFNLSSSKSLRWGTNNVDAQIALNNGVSTSQVFRISFSSSGGDNECQLTNGDSGGPAFIYDANDQTWKLVGINSAMGYTYTNQGIYKAPYSALSYGEYYNRGYIVDLTAYRDQIIPEPATVGLLGAGGLLLLVRVRRRKA